MRLAAEHAAQAGQGVVARQVQAALRARDDLPRRVGLGRRRRHLVTIETPADRAAEQPDQNDDGGDEENELQGQG